MRGFEPLHQSVLMYKDLGQQQPKDQPNTRAPPDVNPHLITPHFPSQHPPHRHIWAALQISARSPKAPKARQPGTQGKEEAVCSSDPGFPSPPQFGPVEGNDLDLPAVNSIRDLHCLHTQLPILLHLPLPLKHGYQWHQKQCPDIEWEGPWSGQAQGDSWVTGVQ